MLYIKGDDAVGRALEPLTAYQRPWRCIYLWWRLSVPTALALEVKQHMPQPEHWSIRIGGSNFTRTEGGVLHCHRKLTLSRPPLSSLLCLRQLCQQEQGEHVEVLTLSPLEQRQEEGGPLFHRGSNGLPRGAVILRNCHFKEQWYQPPSELPPYPIWYVSTYGS